MVSVENQPTTRARMCPLCQRLFLAMSTARTILAGVRGIDCYKRSTGPCCLVREKRSELRPRRIGNRFGKAMIVHHPIDGQIFDRNDIEPIDQTAAFLMGKVAAPIGNPFMNPCNDPAPLSALRCALLGRRKLSLRALQILLISTQELSDTGCFRPWKA